MLTGTLGDRRGLLAHRARQVRHRRNTRSIFQVAAIALLSSWVAAVVVIPYLGYRMLPEGQGRARAAPGHDAHAVYDTAFLQALPGGDSLVCEPAGAGPDLAAAALFAVAILAFRFIPQQFFPELQPARADGST